MKTAELVKYIETNDTEDNANDILYCLNIKAEERFECACKMLDNVLTDIKKTYPDACYMSDDNVLRLYLGNTHTNPEYEFNKVRKHKISNDCLEATQYYFDDYYVTKD